MNFIKQFSIILVISFLGEVLNYLLPLPIPASIYGLVIMLICLMTGVVPPESVRGTGKFLIEIMPLMFIPAAVGLLESWGILQPVWIPVIAITVISTVAVIAVTGMITQWILRKGLHQVNNLLQESVFFGVAISILAYEAGALLKKKFKLAIFNPILIATAVTIIVLVSMNISYDHYYEGAKYLSYFLTPATVCLAIPMYEQIQLLKDNWKAVMIGIFSGMMTSLLCVLIMAIAFGLSHETYVTLLPKSITTAIGMGVSEELGGYVTITVAVIIITGILGNMIGESVCRIFRIKEPIARGVALGTASHAIGTAKAMEMGEIEGAMSSLSIAVAGLITVVGASIFSYLW